MRQIRDIISSLFGLFNRLFCKLSYDNELVALFFVSYDVNFGGEAKKKNHHRHLVYDGFSSFGSLNRSFYKLPYDNEPIGAVFLCCHDTS